MEKRKDKINIENSLELLASSAIFIFFSVFFSKILTYTYRVIIAREFGPEIYGVYSLAVNILGVVMAISLLGFDGSLVRYVSFYRAKKDNNTINYLTKLTFTISLVFSCLLGLVLFLISKHIAIGFFNEPRLLFFIKLFSFAIPLSALTSLLLALINSYEHVKWYSFIDNIIKNSGNLIVLIILILLGFSSNSVAISYFSGVILTLIVTFLVFRKTIKLKKSTILDTKEKKKLKWEFFSYSIPLLFFGAINLVFSWIDSFSLGYYKSAVEVGLYNAAFPLAGLLNIAPQLFLRLFFPIITKNYEKNNISTIKELSKQVGKWIFAINLPIFILIIIFPGYLINLFFSSEYSSASIALVILAVNAFIFSFLRLSNRIIAMEGKSLTLLADIIISLILNILLNIYLIPRPLIFGLNNSSGLIGAAIATSVSNVFLGLIFVIQTNKSLGIIPIRRKMINISFAGLILIGLSLYLKNYLYQSTTLFILSAIFISITYIILIIAFRCIDKFDRDVLKNLLFSKNRKAL